VPLRSTRSEVIKLLGNPTHSQITNLEYFDLADEAVTIKWIDPTCQRKYPRADGEVVRPEDLVLSISVFPKKPLSPKALKLSPMLTVTPMGCLIPNGPCTLCTDEGLCFTTEKGSVTKIDYSATSDEFKAWIQEHKACQSSIKGAT
jgi:hypothetical protein